MLLLGVSVFVEDLERLERKNPAVFVLQELALVLLHGLMSNTSVFALVDSEGLEEGGVELLLEAIGRPLGDVNQFVSEDKLGLSALVNSTDLLAIQVADGLGEALVGGFTDLEMSFPVAEFVSARVY